MAGARRRHLTSTHFHSELLIYILRLHICTIWCWSTIVAVMLCLVVFFVFCDGRFLVGFFLPCRTPRTQPHLTVLLRGVLIFFCVILSFVVSHTSFFFRSFSFFIRWRMSCFERVLFKATTCTTTQKRTVLIVFFSWFLSCYPSHTLPYHAVPYHTIPYRTVPHSRSMRPFDQLSPEGGRRDQTQRRGGGRG